MIFIDVLVDLMLLCFDLVMRSSFAVLMNLSCVSTASQPGIRSET